MNDEGTAVSAQLRAGSSEALEYQLEFLKLEFQSINESIGRIDETTGKVKNWAIITWAGGIAVGLGRPELSHYLWLTGTLPLLFFFVDAWWRRIQRSFIFRNRVISDFLNGPMLMESFRQQGVVGLRLLDPRAKALQDTAEYKDFTSIWRTMRFREVAAFYVGLSLMSVAVWAAVVGWHF